MIPELSIAGIAVPVLLTVIMGLIYKFIPAINDQYKAVVTMGVGVVLAVVAMFYSAPEAVTVKMWIEHIVAGILIGAMAIGVYEGARTFYRPRE